MDFTIITTLASIAIVTSHHVFDKRSLNLAHNVPISLPYLFIYLLNLIKAQPRVYNIGQKYKVKQQNAHFIKSHSHKKLDLLQFSEKIVIL